MIKLKKCPKAASTSLIIVDMLKAFCEEGSQLRISSTPENPALTVRRISFSSTKGRMLMECKETIGVSSCLNRT